MSDLPKREEEQGSRIVVVVVVDVDNIDHKISNHENNLGDVP